MESALNGTPSDLYFETLVTGIVEHRDQLDELIRSNLENWTLERLANIDRNLLRIAVYEMIHRVRMFLLALLWMK